MGDSIDLLWDAWDSSDEAFDAAYKRTRAAVRAFMSAVASMVDQRGVRFGRASRSVDV